VRERTFKRNLHEIVRILRMTLERARKTTQPRYQVRDLST
jgi:hypothetical protein